MFRRTNDVGDTAESTGPSTPSARTILQSTRVTESSLKVTHSLSHFHTIADTRGELNRNTATSRGSRALVWGQSFHVRSCQIGARLASLLQGEDHLRTLGRLGDPSGAGESRTLRGFFRPLERQCEPRNSELAGKGASPVCILDRSDMEGNFTLPAARASDPRPLLSATVHMSQCTQPKELRPSP